MSIVLKNRIESLLAGPFFVAFSPLFLLAELYLRFKKSLGVPKWNPAGKIILITGASSGIGASLAELYARQGAILIIMARRQEELDAVAEKCKSLGSPNVYAITVDVADDVACKVAIQKAGDIYGKLDLVVLNAGISMGSRTEETDIALYKRLNEVNVNGVIAGCVYSLPYLRKSTRGKVVVVSSLLGVASGPLRSGYSSSKFAIKGFLDSVRLEEPGMDFTMIYPGVVKTEINRTRLGNASSLDLEKGMTSEEAALLIADAVKRRARDECFTFSGNLLWFVKDFCPTLRDYLMNRAILSMSKKAVKKE
ncbi:hypothetical protein HDU76_006148 [Blyttiomyces sp. JEL0837]|nr:hypothetical protein HDU76_006148 [Blyttiomyces sp. JEL0837]